MTMCLLLIVNILTTMIAVIQSADSMPEWKPVEWTIPVDLATKSLFLRTSTTTHKRSGEGRKLTINFQDSTGDDAGGFFIEISETDPKYSFTQCTNSAGETIIDLPAAIPAVDDIYGFRVFKVESYGNNGLKISCNNEEMLTFEPSTEQCSGSIIWTREKKKVEFGYFGMNTDYDSHATQSYATLSRDEDTWISSGDYDRWEDNPRYTAPIPVDFATESILLRTDTDGGVDKQLSFHFTKTPYDFRSSSTAGVDIDLDQENSTYVFDECFNSEKILPAAIPAPDQNGYRIFRIEEYRLHGLKISCNDEVILSFQPSKRECDSVIWARQWLQQKRGIKFGGYHWYYTPAIRQYAVVPREDKEEDTNKYDIDTEWSWTPLFTYKDPLPLDLDTTAILLKIGKRGIGRKQFRMYFFDAEGNKTGGFSLTMFEKNPMYDFFYCTSSYFLASQTYLPWDFPDPDENGDRIFKIERYGYYGLQVTCNGEDVLKFQPTFQECSALKQKQNQYAYDYENWIADVKRMTFDFIYFSGVESYYALVPRGIDITIDTPDNSINKEENNDKTVSDDILNCFQCEEISITDWEGNELPDTEIPADLNTALKPRPCRGSNKPCPGTEFDACLDNIARVNLTRGHQVKIIQKDCVIRERLKEDADRIYSTDKICEYGIEAELKHILGEDYDYLFCSVPTICKKDSCNMASRGATISFLVITAAFSMLVLNL